MTNFTLEIEIGTTHAAHHFRIISETSERGKLNYQKKSKCDILHPYANHYRTFAVLGNFKFKWEFMIVSNDKLYS